MHRPWAVLFVGKNAKKRKKLRISKSTALGSRVVFDEEGVAVAPLAQLALPDQNGCAQLRVFPLYTQVWHVLGVQTSSTGLCCHSLEFEALSGTNNILQHQVAPNIGGILRMNSRQE